jgi:hypothetical protein
MGPILLVCSLALAPGLFAQQAAQLPATESRQSQNQFATAPVTASPAPTPDPAVPKDDRILWTLPNYLTVENASTLPPLTPGQKFALIAKDTFDPVTFGFIGLEAGINQASNTDPTLRQGLKGYAKRYGLAFADNGIGNFMTSAVFPIALHQDPRFYQMGKGGFIRRAWYAGSRVLITRSDAGKTECNYSEFLGNVAAAVISNAYHPGPRTLGSNINIWATQIAWDAVSYEMKEFWPDIHHRFTHKH